MDEKLNEFEKIEGFICPAEFWPALGYRGEARFVGVYWEPAGDEACWCDGRRTVVGAEWAAYNALIGHNFEPKDAAHQLLGSSEERATHWLVIERAAERAWLAKASEARAFLRSQWPVEDAAADWQPALTVFEAWEIPARVGRPWAAGPPSVDKVEQGLVETAERYEALEAALARRPAEWMWAHRSGAYGRLTAPVNICSSF